MVRQLLFYGTIVTVIGCGTALMPSGPDTGGAGADGTVVVLGSSTAAGRGPSDARNAWVSRFDRALHEAGLDYEVVNLARDGYTTYHLMPDAFVAPESRPTPDTSRNISRALDFAPSAIVINLPSNDVWLGHGIGEQLANYDTILERAQEENVPVWVSTTQPRSFPEEAKRRTQVAMKDSTIARFGGRAIDFWTGLADQGAGLKSLYDSGDGAHCNDTAHGLFAERVQSSTLWYYLEQTTRLLAAHL
jgi:lysophospholipase L1-like esterase